MIFFHPFYNFCFQLREGVKQLDSEWDVPGDVDEFVDYPVAVPCSRERAAAPVFPDEKLRVPVREARLEAIL